MCPCVETVEGMSWFGGGFGECVLVWRVYLSRVIPIFDLVIIECRALSKSQKQILSNFVDHKNGVLPFFCVPASFFN